MYILKDNKITIIITSLHSYLSSSSSCPSFCPTHNCLLACSPPFVGYYATTTVYPCCIIISGFGLHSSPPMMMIFIIILLLFSTQTSTIASRCTLLRRSSTRLLTTAIESSDIVFTMYVLTRLYIRFLTPLSGTNATSISH